LVFEAPSGSVQRTDRPSSHGSSALLSPLPLASAKNRVSISLGRSFAHLEVVALGVRGHKAVEVAPGIAAVDDVEAVGGPERDAAGEEVGDLRDQDLVLTARVGRVQVGHELHGRRAVVDVEAGDVLATGATTPVMMPPATVNWRQRAGSVDPTKKDRSRSPGPSTSSSSGQRLRGR
jgi:hypothetical protein